MVAAATMPQAVPRTAGEVWALIPKVHLYGAYQRLAETLPPYGAMMTYWQLAGLWGVSRNTAIRYANQLEAAGVLTITRQPRRGKVQSANWYVLPALAAAAKQDAGSTKVAPYTPKIVVLPAPQNDTASAPNLGSMMNDDDDNHISEIGETSPTTKNQHPNAQALIAAGIDMPVAARFNDLDEAYVHEVIAAAAANHRLTNKPGWIVKQLTGGHKPSATINKTAKRLADYANDDDRLPPSWTKPPTPTPSARTPQRVTHAWGLARDQLDIQFDRASFDTWFKDLHLVDYDEAANTVTLAARNQYVLEMLQGRLSSSVTRVLADALGDDSVTLSFIAQADAHAPAYA